LRSWGWDLAIVGGQPNTPIVTSIVYVYDEHGCCQHFFFRITKLSSLFIRNAIQEDKKKAKKKKKSNTQTKHSIKSSNTALDMRHIVDQRSSFTSLD
jgi:hypothetical protein